jgi:transcriptional regulator with XRE-family HTH domain
MTNFGDTLRKLRLAQKMGLRETAVAVSISPSYLSRIERGKENPPKPEIIKALARILAADPDVLFRLAASTDPDIASLVKENSKVSALLRLFMEHAPTEEQLEEIFFFAKKKLSQKKL